MCVGYANILRVHLMCARAAATTRDYAQERRTTVFSAHVQTRMPVRGNNAWRALTSVALAPSVLHVHSSRTRRNRARTRATRATKPHPANAAAVCQHKTARHTDLQSPFHHELQPVAGWQGASCSPGPSTPWDHTVRRLRRTLRRNGRRWSILSSSPTTVSETSAAFDTVAMVVFVVTT